MSWLSFTSNEHFLIVGSINYIENHNVGKRKHKSVTFTK